MNTDKLRDAIASEINATIDRYYSGYDTTDTILTLPEMQELLHPKVCEWKPGEDYDGCFVLISDCGLKFGSKRGYYNFCPSCGGKIVIGKIKEKED